MSYEGCANNYEQKVQADGPTIRPKPHQMVTTKTATQTDRTRPRNAYDSKTRAEARAGVRVGARVGAEAVEAVEAVEARPTEEGAAKAPVGAKLGLQAGGAKQKRGREAYRTF